jgi:putative transposase
MMARGNRREKIVRDDTDRKNYEMLWYEAVKMTGWKVYAWILMDNHYHAIIQTPEANLVEGMGWIQNTWTRRYNSRHKVWGHLFGGRYKSILCEEGRYLKALIHYVHLNPVRARMITREERLETYRWSSLADYVAPARKRRSWISVEEGLKHFQLQDTAEGRRRYLSEVNNYIDWQQPKQSGLIKIEEQTLHSTLRRGWYFGTETYRERALQYIEVLKKTKKVKLSPQSGYSGPDNKDHGVKMAEAIVEAGLMHYGLQDENLGQLRKEDVRKVVIATLIRERTTVRLSWIAARLQMGVTSRVSFRVNEMKNSKKQLAVRKKITAKLETI